MLLVIFGTGASYDSVPHLPSPSNSTETLDPGIEHDRPPLANELFEDRPRFIDAMRRFSDCMPLIPLLRKDGIAVERELAKFQEQTVKFPQRHRQLAAIRYYLHFALWECERAWHERHRGITNYATLLDEIERWRFEFDQQVCFVTFNYDTMIEEAMQQVLGFKILNELHGYLWSRDYILLKLHGSINWGRELNVGISIQPPYLDRAL
jgi:hypothetical protein